MSTPVKLEFQLQRFKDNIRLFQLESQEEMLKTLKAGASAYVTTAVKHTPPSIGLQKIDPRYLADGILYDLKSWGNPYGRRRVYDLKELVRNPKTGRLRGLYGKLLRKGYFYLVSIFRSGKRPVCRPCRTEAEATEKARESYRGLTRAAWGLNMQSLTGKLPPAVRSLLTDRPDLSKKTGLNRVQLDKDRLTVTVTNEAIKSGEGFLQNLDAAASTSALRTMNDKMEKFFKKRREL